MSSPTTSQRHLSPEIQRAMNASAVWTLHGMHAAPGISLERVAALYVTARENGQLDAHSSLRCVEQSLRLARTASEAMIRLRERLPGRPRPRVDGTQVRISLPTWTASRALVAVPGGADADHRERIAKWTVQPDLAVRWRHQVANSWRPADSDVGTVLAAQTDAVTGDLRIWCRLHRADVIEAVLFGDVSASPGIDPATSRSERGWSSYAQERTQTWKVADVKEVSLTWAGEEALGGVDVDMVSGVSADLMADWAQTRAAATPGQQQHRADHADQVSAPPTITDWDVPPSARSDRTPVQPMRRTAAGTAYSVRTSAQLGLPGLRVRR